MEKHWKWRRERDVNLTQGRQQANQKSGPDYSARYPVLFSRRVVVAKSLYYNGSESLDYHVKVAACQKNRSAKRTCVGFDLLLYHSVGVLVLNVSIREFNYYKWIGHHWKDIGMNLELDD